MSRVGKLPVAVPGSVKVEINGLNVKVSGPKGELNKSFGKGISIKLENNAVVVLPIDNSKRSKSMWGTTRNVINGMVHGVNSGFKQTLEMIGVGYRAAVKGQYLSLSLAKSHNTIVAIPKEIKVAVQKNTIIELESHDKELLGQFAAILIKQRPPEPYKGKGIRKEGQYVQRKEGKRA